MTSKSLPRHIIKWGCVLLFFLGLANSGCKKDPKAEAQKLKSCTHGSQCIKPNQCVKGRKRKKGVCVHPCKGPGTCFPGFRCTGSYVRKGFTGLTLGKARAYCQKSDIPPGGACGKIGHGCQAGYACFKRKCVKICSKTGKCGPKEKCISIVSKKGINLPWIRKKALYKGCLEASLPVGARCSRVRMPLCQPGSECWRGRCLKVCKRGGECGPGTKCVPIVGRTRSIIKSYRTLFNACAPATKPLKARCSTRRWPLCKRGSRCFRGQCARICKGNADCSSTEKCLRITQRYGPLRNKIRTLYRACVSATLEEGRLCGPRMPSMCKQGLRCWKRRCVQRCRTHKECPRGKACHGIGFYNTKATKAMLARAFQTRGDFYFCIRGRRKYTPRATYNACRSGRDCLPMHVCAKGRCRPYCKRNSSCPPYFATRPRCKRVRLRSGKRRKICYGY